MGDVTVNGNSTLRGTLRVPRLGVWHSDVVIDATGIAEGAAEIRTPSGELVYRGTIIVTGERDATTEARIVGGAGGLSSVLAPRFYRQAPLRVVLGDIARECGEVLSSSIDPNLLTMLLAHWTRESAPGGRALESAIAATGIPGLVWRVLGDGTLWVGEETWPNVEIPAEVLATSPVDESVEFAVEVPFALLAPGVLWQEKRVTYVEHSWDDSSATSRAWFERLPAFVAPGAPNQREAPDRVKSALEALVNRVTRGTVFERLHQATVRAQDGARVDLEPDSPGLPSLVGVPLLGPSPGHLALVQPGSRVLLAFVGADPRFPVALWFEQDNAATALLTLAASAIKLGPGATKGAARVDDTVTALAALTTWASDVAAKLNSAGHPLTAPFPSSIGKIATGSGITTIE